MDGALYHDALAVVGCHVASGYIWPLGVWERPEKAGEDYEHDLDEVDAVDPAAHRFKKKRSACAASPTFSKASISTSMRSSSIQPSGLSGLRIASPYTARRTRLRCSWSCTSPDGGTV
ncbi:MAG TPA: hypothetical protein VFY32_08920 [Solirubrobacteraceae bacterium]|nr:hypothetical protein [Solirubrobacteraceae bacterium]